MSGDQSTISQEMKEILRNLKEKLNNLQTKNNSLQNLQTKKSQKEKELEGLKNAIIKDTVDLTQITELLKNQEASIEENNQESLKKLEITKRTILRLNITNEDKINQLCQLQTEITNLEIQLQNSQANVKQKSKELTENTEKIVQMITYNFSGSFSNFTGGVGNSGEVTGSQTVNVFPQMEQQPQIIQNPPLAQN